MLKRLFLFLAFFSAIPVFAQAPVQEQRCFAPACALNPWRTVNDGDTLVVIVRSTLIAPPKCQKVNYCGDFASTVSDNYGNVYQAAYHFNETSSSEVFVAFDVKGRPAGCCTLPVFIIGGMASAGYSGYGTSDGGSFKLETLVLEYPPATGFDGHATFAQYSNGGGTRVINIYPGVTTTSPKALLIAWVDNPAWSGIALHVVNPEFPWRVLTDDGFLCVSTQTASAGTYDFDAQYDNIGFWHGGIVALALR